MPKEKILILVKTYPVRSQKYDELVCTAGIREDGTWIRLYPIKFRTLAYNEQYKKYDWIEVDVRRRRNDFRPETFVPTGAPTVVSHLGTGSDKRWTMRRRLVLKKVYTDISLLIKEAKTKPIYTSLAVFKPTIIHDFIHEKVDREWSKSQLADLKQINLFEKQGKELKPLKKLPYKFSYVFSDSSNRKCTLMIEDWEVGALYWKMYAKYQDEAQAIKAVKDKYLNDFAKKKDLYFFLGTTKQHQLVGPSPFIIIGTFHPPVEKQLSLL